MAVDWVKWRTGGPVSWPVSYWGKALDIVGFPNADRAQGGKHLRIGLGQRDGGLPTREIKPVREQGLGHIAQRLMRSRRKLARHLNRQNPAFGQHTGKTGKQRRVVGQPSGTMRWRKSARVGYRAAMLRHRTRSGGDWRTRLLCLGQHRGRIIDPDDLPPRKPQVRHLRQ